MLEHEEDWEYAGVCIKIGRGGVCLGRLCLLGPVRRGLYCRRVFESSGKSNSGVLVRVGLGEQDMQKRDFDLLVID